MDSLQRIYKLHQAISSRRHPVSCLILQDELECSRATVRRIITEMRLYFNAPLEYSREHNGYHCCEKWIKSETDCLKEVLKWTGILIRTVTKNRCCAKW